MDAAPKEQWRVSQPAAVAQSEAAVAQGDHRPRADLVAARSLEAAEPLMAARPAPAAAPVAAVAELAVAAPAAADVAAGRLWWLRLLLLWRSLWRRVGEHMISTCGIGSA